MKRIILPLVLFCLISSTCLAARQAKKKVEEGNRLYRKGEFNDALKSYEEAFLDEPDSDIVNFDLGAALYKAKSYKGAIEHFQRSLVSEDESLEQKASYNIGNAKYKHGISQEDTNLTGAIGLLKEALRHYERAISLNPEDEDAKYNYEFVKKELERLEKKLQKQQQQQKQKQQQKQQQQKQQQPQDKQDQQDQQQQQQEEEEKQPEDQQQQEQEKQPEDRDQQQQQQPDRGTEEERSEAAPQPEQPNEQMSLEEALMLLESYRQEEEPKGLYKEKMPAVGWSDVLKDW